MYFTLHPKSIDKKETKENSQNVLFKFHKKNTGFHDQTDCLDCK